MGDVKQSMKPASDRAFGMFKKKRKDADTPAKTFADMLVQAEEKLQELILKKESDLETESGQEDYNRKALALLRTMAFHIDAVGDAAEQYSELR